MSDLGTEKDSQALTEEEKRQRGVLKNQEVSNSLQDFEEITEAVKQMNQRHEKQKQMLTELLAQFQSEDAELTELKKKALSLIVKRLEKM